MRTTKDPNHVIEWEGFANVDRTALQDEVMNNVVDPFDTKIQGPWMKRWEITHHNRHTAS